MEKKLAVKFITKLDAIICPFDQYLNAKEEWVKKHPDAIIKKEIENVFMGAVQVPDPNRIGSTMQAPALLIAVGIVYETRQETISLSSVKFSNLPG